MIAANSPFNSASPIPAPNPTQKLRRSSNLGFRSSERRFWVTRTRMDFLQRLVGGGCFRGSTRQGLKVEIDSGGEDVFDAAAAAANNNAVPEHLVVMVNGIIGRYDLSDFVT